MTQAESVKKIAMHRASPVATVAARGLSTLVIAHYQRCCLITTRATGHHVGRRWARLDPAARRAGRSLARGPRSWLGDEGARPTVADHRSPPTGTATGQTATPAARAPAAAGPG